MYPYNKSPGWVLCRDGKESQFWVRIQFGFFNDKGSVLFGYFQKITFEFGSSSLNVGFGSCSVLVLHRWNWKDVSMVVISYGLTVIVSTS